MKRKTGVLFRRKGDTLGELAGDGRFVTTGVKRASA